MRRWFRTLAIFFSGLVVGAILSPFLAEFLVRYVLERPRRPDMEAIGNLRSIAGAQAHYASACADGGYARTLDDLRLAPAGGLPYLGPQPATLDYEISMRMPAGAELPGLACNQGRRASRYFAEARPFRGRDGLRFFAVDERAVLYHSDQPIPEGMSGAQPVQ
jgi:hypothetical protein